MKTCPGCKGHKIRYLIEGGDHLNLDTWIRCGKPLANKVQCGTCNGTGKVPDN